MKVEVRNNNVEQALRILKRKTQKEGPWEPMGTHRDPWGPWVKPSCDMQLSVPKRW